MVLPSVASCTCREQPWNEWFNLPGKRFYRHVFEVLGSYFYSPEYLRWKEQGRNQCAVFHVPHWLSSPCSFSGAISSDCSKAVTEHTGKQFRNNMNLSQWNLHYAKVALIQLRKKIEHCVYEQHGYYIRIWSLPALEIRSCSQEQPCLLCPGGNGWEWEMESPASSPCLADTSACKNSAS